MPFPRLGAVIALALITPHLRGQIRITPLLNLDGQASDPSLSPDGKTLVFTWCKPDYTCGLYTRAMSGGEPRLLTGGITGTDDGLPSNVQWSPDGKRIAFTRFFSHFDKRLFVRDLASGAEKDYGLVCDHAPRSNWTPDGHFLITSVSTEEPPRTFSCRIALLSAETGKSVRFLTRRGDVSAPSPDGRLIAYSNGGALLLLKLADKAPNAAPVVLAREPREISIIAWTPDSKQIMYQVWGDVPYLRRLSVVPPGRPRTIQTLESQLSIAQFLPDGRALATQTTQLEALWRADLSSTPPRLETIKNPDCSAGAPGCSPDGRLKAFVNTSTGISEISVANGDGSNERPLVKSIPRFSNPHDDGVPGSLAWSPDSKWIAFTVFPRSGNADVRSRLYVVRSTGGIPQRLGKGAYALDFPAWAPDSKSLYATQGWPVDDRAHEGDCIVRVNVADGSLTPVGAVGIWPHPSPDGRFLYFFRRSKLFRISPQKRGPAQQVWDKDILWYAAGVGTRFLYLFQDTSQPGRLASKMIRLDPETRDATPLADLPFRPRSGDLSPNERVFYFEQVDDPKQRVVLVEHLF